MRCVVDGKESTENGKTKKPKWLEVSNWLLTK